MERYHMGEQLFYNKCIECDKSFLSNCQIKTCGEEHCVSGQDGYGAYWWTDVHNVQIGTTTQKNGLQSVITVEQ